MKRASILALCGVALLAMVVAPTLSNAAPAGGKPRIAVLEFKNKADNQWWGHGGAEAAQDVFVTELVKSGKFTVVDRERLDAMMQEKGLQQSGDIDPKTAIKLGKILGLNYLLTGAVTEYGNTDVGGGGGGVSAGKRKFVAALNARLINASTGEVVWADEATQEESSIKVSVFGFGGGVDDNRMFDKVMKPCIQKLVASLKAADL
jgi:curli biogenesis system outer membrane secretion channel CsgG